MSATDPLIDVILADDFRVLRQLGFGGYARVYLAEQMSVGRRKVAVKVLHAMHMDSKQAVAALKREATYLAMLRSPCFPRIFRTGLTPQGTPYFIMEFVAGRTVEAILKESGAMSVEAVVRILDEVCEGISEMHGRDIVHRDMKTGNLALEDAPGGRNHVKLLDLGSAKPAYEQDPAGAKAWMATGSPPYLPPEVVAKGTVSEAGDIYSLGAVAYEMLCGIRAIHLKDTTPEAYVAYLRSNQPIPTFNIRTAQPDVPEAVDDVVSKALARDPAQRFPSVTAFRMALLDAAGQPVRQPLVAPAAKPAPGPAPERGPDRQAPSGKPGTPIQKPQSSGQKLASSSQKLKDSLSTFTRDTISKLIPLKSKKG